MSELTRRDLLRSTAALTAFQQHEHPPAPEPKKDAQAPKFFNEHEYRTLARLTELILPADEHSPGALEAGAPQYIDLLAGKNAELAAIYTGGLAWLDRETERRYSVKFVEATPERQSALLDLIAYRKNAAPELGPGIRFFEWVRNMTVDAFYTSPAGIRDIGYQGNQAVAEFRVPQEAVEYALKRSGLA
jgi:hypothetical protein